MPRCCSPRWRPRAACRANLRQAYAATALYATDHDGRLPHRVPADAQDGTPNIRHSWSVEKWGLLYPAYLDDLRVLYCPSRRKGATHAIDATPDQGHALRTFWDGSDAYTECSYSHRSGTQARPLRLGEVSNAAQRVLACDTFWINSTGIGGSSVCHGDRYYAVLTFDGRVTGFIDASNTLEAISVVNNGAVITNLGYPHIERTLAADGGNP